jgi:CO dehydrogenase nickel-insertion accessory protein CooC1
MELARSAGMAFYGAVLNKMASKEQENQVAGRLNDAGVPSIGSIGFQEALQAACLAGKPLSEVTLSIDLKGFIDNLLQQQERG